MRKEFNGLQAMLIKGAKKQGLKKCSFSKERENTTLDDILEEYDKFDEEQSNLD